MFKFKLGRVKVGISIWFAAFFAIILFVADNTILLYGMFAMMCHELGHFIIMALSGCPARGFYLLLGRLVIVPARRISYSQHELPILAGGIAANVLCALIFAAYGNMAACLVNLATAVYNALPAGELDGGAILLALLGRRFMPKHAYNIHIVISIIISLLLMTAGFIMIMRGFASAPVLFCGIYIMAHSIKNMQCTM